MRLAPSVYASDDQKVTAVRLDAVIHERPDPLAEIKRAQFRDGVVAGAVVTLCICLFLGLLAWQIAAGL